MPTVTLDTNVLPVDDLRTACESKGFHFAVVTVTDRELTGSDFHAELQYLGMVPETAVWDEGRFGEGHYGSTDEDDRLERLLHAISNNSFPLAGFRASLRPGQRRQRGTL